jgi:hypothetical protein
VHRDLPGIDLEISVFHLKNPSGQIHFPPTEIDLPSNEPNVRSSEVEFPSNQIIFSSHQIDGRPKEMAAPETKGRAPFVTSAWVLRRDRITG